MQPVVMLLVSGVIMFSVIGGLSLLAHYYTLNGIKSKTVGDGQHGGNKGVGWHDNLVSWADAQRF